MKTVTILASLFALTAFAQDDSLATVSTEGSSSKLKAGEKGKVVIAFHVAAGSHISAEAPLKLELSSEKAALDKKLLTLADSRQKGEPRFEVGFGTEGKGSTAIDAKLTYFVCTDTKCVRQSKKLSVAVEVQ
jgi:hypothetical protein